MKFRLTLIFILGLYRICLSQNFSGQVFLLSREYFEDKCEVYAGCDCCGTDLFFLSSTKFSFINRCLSGDTYYTGTYSVKSSTLSLIFNKKHLSEIVSEDYKLI